VPQAQQNLEEEKAKFLVRIAAMQGAVKAAEDQVEEISKSQFRALEMEGTVTDVVMMPNNTDYAKMAWTRRGFVDEVQATEQVP
jgi:hypothetical protein